MVDLVGKRVSIKDPYFLQIFYPHYSIVNNLSNEIDYSRGIIYNGVVSDSAIEKIKYLTNNKYILISDLCDIKLETSVDYIKTFFPVLENKADRYSNYDLDDLLPLVKVYYILQKKIPLLKENELSVYSLFEATVQPGKIDEVYFKLLQDMDIHVIISSFFSFLIKVNEEDYNTQNGNYKKLINRVHIRCGSKIKNAIRQYIESDQIPELAFWNLLHNIAG